MWLLMHMPTHTNSDISSGTLVPIYRYWCPSTGKIDQNRQKSVVHETKLAPKHKNFKKTVSPKKLWIHHGQNNKLGMIKLIYLTCLKFKITTCYFLILKVSSLRLPYLLQKPIFHSCLTSNLCTILKNYLINIL